VSTDTGTHLAAATSLVPSPPEASVAPPVIVAADWPYDVQQVRADFPILSRRIHGGMDGAGRADGGVPLVYLDSAATSQKPAAVLNAEREYNERHNANVHRGIHTLAEEATALYEGARQKVATFLGAADPREIIFSKNVTEGLNLLAHAIGSRLRPGDEVVVTEMEHHSNLVPWQLACQRSGATLRWFGLTDDGRLDLERADAEGLINSRTKVVAFVHQSNILGTVNPVAEIVGRARAVGALTVLDGAQSVPHGLVGVKGAEGDIAGPAKTVAELGVDFLGFTSHKMLGPTGIGGLWGRYDLLAELPPFLGGGDMVDVVTMGATTYAAPPHRFEAGTPPIAQAVGLGAAVDYLSALGIGRVARHEHLITEYALGALAEIPGLRVIGPPSAQGRGAAISFALPGIHPHDTGQLLDERGIAVRVGQHCARPVCLRYGVPATTRLSAHVYTTTQEIDALVEGLHTVQRFFSK
jgi:cysteine desulfurase/selenocysteine lyase